jgi:hypothetical protein
MLVKSIQRTFLKLIFWTAMTIFQRTGAQNCLVLQSTNIYGGQKYTFDKNSCFEVLVADLKEIIVHAQMNVVGFTFNFTNGKVQSFMELFENTSHFRIDLITSHLIGAKINVGEGIEGLQFQLYDWKTNQESFSEIIGKSSGYFSYFNSNFMNINYLKIDSIQGCIDRKGSNYFPCLSFSYSFSECPFRSSYTMLNSMISTLTTETTTSSSTTLTLETTTATIESTTSSSTTLTTETSTFTTETTTSSSTTLTLETTTATIESTTSSSTTLTTETTTATTETTTSSTNITTAFNLNATRSYTSQISTASAGGIFFSSLYGYANDGIFNYILDKGLHKVFQFNISWASVNIITLPFLSPYYLTYVTGNWFITGNNGIYKTGSSFASILASVTTGPHFGLYYYLTSSTIYAVKNHSIIEYTTGLVTSYTKTISGYSLWSITASGSTFYIGTSSSVVLAMTDRVVTGTFDACRSHTYPVNSIFVQGSMMMTECYGDTYFYTGSGSSFSYSFGKVRLGTTAKGAWVELANKLLITDVGTYMIWF